MGCCHSHSDDSGEKKRGTPPPSSGSSFPLELDGCTTAKPRPHRTSTRTSRHSPPFPLPVVAGSTNSSKSPPFLEEESVKEVIPESANRRSPLTPPPPPNAAWFPPQPPDLRKPPSLSEVDRVVGDDEETSEIYSASESLSTSTIPEKMQEGDDWGDHKMLDRDRAEQVSPCMYSNNAWTSPSKFQRRSRGGGGGNNSSSTPSPNGGGDDSAAYFYSPNSSSRRLEGGMRRSQDPPRRPQLRGVSRPGGRQMGVIPRNAPAAPRPEDKRSGRIRSRSPAMRSGERHNSSMGRTQNADGGEEDKNPGGGEADSLDNPLVSLECFIFL